MTHTKGKWTYENEDITGRGITFQIYIENEPIRICGSALEVNAKRICQTHNSHDGLLEVCKVLRDFVYNGSENEEMLEIADKAIAQAEE